MRLLRAGPCSLRQFRLSEYEMENEIGAGYQNQRVGPIEFDSYFTEQLITVQGIRDPVERLAAYVMLLLPFSVSANKKMVRVRVGDVD